ncbi:zinc finger protein 346 isoform 3-T3 [Morphnus guianensis]
MADGAGSNGDAAGLPVGKEAVDRLIRENGHIFTEAQCKVCSALLISESQRLAHYQSKKHANKVRRYLSIHGGEELAHGKKMRLDAKQDSKQEGSNGEDRNKCCPICNMTFSSPAVATSHYLGKTHAKNMKQQSPKVEEAVPPQKHPAALPTSTVSSNEENKDITDPDKFCSLCHATFNNPLMAKQHYVGKKHRKQETKHKLMAHYGRTPDAPASSFMAFCWTRKSSTCWMLEVNNKQTNHLKIFFKSFFLCHKNPHKQKINYSNSLQATFRYR